MEKAKVYRKPKEVNPHQIIKVSNKSTFLEFMSYGFHGTPEGRVVMNFVKYDDSKEKGSRVVGEVRMSPTISEFLNMTHNLIDGNLGKQIFKQHLEIKKNGGGYGTTHQLNMGGSVFADGTAESRILKVMPGKSAPFVFVAEKGSGEVIEKGIISPTFGKNPDINILVAFQADDLKRAFLTTREHIRAFLSARYAHKMKQMYPKMFE